MWGWKAVERTLATGTTLDAARRMAEREGFAAHVANPGYVLLKRAGTPWALSVDDVSLQLALAETEGGLFLQLRYDTFVLADTGDLERYADELVRRLRGSA